MSKPPSLSEKATGDLLQLLVKRGYFHDEGLPVQPPVDDSFETWKEQKQHPSTSLSEFDPACQVVSTLDQQHYMTISSLKYQVSTELESAGGRMSIPDLAALLMVDLAHIERLAPQFEVAGEDFLSPSFFEKSTEIVNIQLQLSGKLLVSDVASRIFNLPFDRTLRELVQRMQQIDGQLISGDSTALLSPPFLESLKRQVRGAFCAVTSPTLVQSICHEFAWEQSLVLKWVEEMCGDKSLDGELHTGGGDSTAMYVPHFYKRRQRKGVDDYFNANGFISVQKCLALGLLESQMGAFVKESFPNAVVLSKVVVHPDIIISPVEAAIQEAIAAETLADLQLLLPLEMLEFDQDIRTIVNGQILPSLAGDTGVSVISTECAFFVSHGMIQQMQKVLPPLIESFAKIRAQDVDQEEPEQDSLTPIETPAATKKATARDKRRAKKAAAKRSANEGVVTYGVVPLKDVATAIMEAFPGLSGLQNDEPLPEEIAWEPGDDYEGHLSGGPISELCRAALYTNELRETCDQCVGAELQRLRSAKESKSSRSRKDAASKVRSVEAAFEDPACFAAACYSLQIAAKFIQYMENLGDANLIDDLKKEFLRGCCADFASRITQYTLFKNEMEEGIFRFSQVETDDENGLPAYCHPVDITTRKYPTAYLSYSAGSDAERQEPLDKIRGMLPGSVGVALARLWVYCGGDCYEGGVKMSDDGTRYTRPGDMEHFLSHVQDNCLTLCGLPYKKLDKKSEKQFLFSRRQELTQQLKLASNASDILDLTVMLIFQKVKNIAVSGAYLQGPILQLLTQEKKIPEPVRDVLLRLAEQLRNAESTDDALVEKVKGCGLCRDISKHQLEQ